jgi:hypothetical protein
MAKKIEQEDIEDEAQNENGEEDDDDDGDQDGEEEEGEDDDEGDEDEDEESEPDEINLDEDGRVPGGILPDNPKPPLLNYDFRTFHDFLKFDEGDSTVAQILKDAKTVFTARNGRAGEAYSAGETYFLPAAMTPRCGLERLARAVFNLHTAELTADEDYDINLSGAEWWTLVLDGAGTISRDSYSPLPPGPNTRTQALFSRALLRLWYSIPSPLCLADGAAPAPLLPRRPLSHPPRASAASRVRCRADDDAAHALPAPAL